MEYNKQQIKEGINLHIIKTDKFKTNLLSVFITTPLEKEHVTKNALIPMVLRRGNMENKTQEELSIALEEMYGASFDCGIEKNGDNQILKFYLEVINDEFIPTQENVLKQALNTIINVIFNPLIKNNEFIPEYIETEKENLKQIIESKKDNKAKYAFERCLEEMYKEQPFGIHKFGYVEDLEKIEQSQLYSHYKELINKSKIDIFISGQVESQEIINILNQNKQIKELDARKPNYIITKPVEKTNSQEEQTVKESMDVTQGKLVIGVDILNTNEDYRYIASVYNAILGGTANSKLFQNVREKASLAYTTNSNYIKPKNNIIIKAGIQIENYEKALQIIKQQLNDMQQGNFTEEDLNNAKTSIISTIKFIPDEQDTTLSYYFGQELSNTYSTIEEYIKSIETVTHEEVQTLAQNVKINTIYFLKD